MAKKKDYTTMATTPFETGIKNFTSVAKFYMYYAPNLGTPQSRGRIEGAEADAVLKQMLKDANMEKKSRFLMSIRKESWKKVDLEENEIDFEIPRMLCKRNKNESELQALLRHIRNAFAHGNVFIWRKRKGNFVFLVDYDDDKKKKMSAKILVSQMILERWKAILEDQLPTGE